MYTLNENKAIVSNIIWRFADRWGSQIISFVITILIARVLEPEAYGVVVIVNAFINIFSVFADCGLGDSLIQKKNADELDYSTALIANVCLGLVVYLIIFLLSPYIALAYKNNSLTSLIRVSAISIIISTYKNIQHAYVAKRLLFKKYFFASLFGTIASGIVGIVMAQAGYGSWSLIISNLSDMTIDSIFCYFLVKLEINFKFSKDRFYNLFSFGSKMLFTSLLYRIYNKIYQLIIGLYYDSESLAYFDKGDSLTSKITGNIDYSISSVLFPAMSNVQDNIETLKELSKKTLKIDTYIITPLLMGLFVMCDKITTILLTEKWLDAVPYIRIYCIVNLFIPITTINNNITKAMGESNKFLKEEIVKRFLSIIILLITIKYGIKAIAYGLLLNSLKDQIIDSFYSKKLINYGYLEQLKDILPNYALGILMMAIVSIVGLININIYLLSILQIITGAMVYIGLSLVLNMDSTKYIKKLIFNKQ